MADADLIASKLHELADRVARIRSHCPRDAAALVADRDAADLVAFNLQLAVQSCLDLARHLIASEGLQQATTLAESFERLAEHGILSATTAEALGRAAGMRNLIAHGYVDVDPSLLHRTASEGPADLDRFAHEVAAWLHGSPA